MSSGGIARGYLLGRSRPFFCIQVEQSMNRIDMLFSINGLLLLKDPLSAIHLRVATMKCKLITAMILLINNIRREVGKCRTPLMHPEIVVVHRY